MMEYKINQDENLFSSEWVVSYKNTLCLKKENRGVFHSVSLIAGINKLKYIIRIQIVNTIMSIVNERRFAYQNAWKPENIREENISSDYHWTLEQCSIHAGKVQTLGFHDMLLLTSKLCDTHLKKLIPSESSKKHENIFNKVAELNRFCKEIEAELDQIYKQETVKI